MNDLFAFIFKYFSDVNAVVCDSCPLLTTATTATTTEEVMTITIARFAMLTYNERNSNSYRYLHKRKSVHGILKDSIVCRRRFSLTCVCLQHFCICYGTDRTIEVWQLWTPMPFSWVPLQLRPMSPCMEPTCVRVCAPYLSRMALLHYTNSVFKMERQWKRWCCWIRTIKIRYVR